MAVLLTKFIYTDDAINDTEIDDCTQCSISLGTEIKNNNFRIKLKNRPINIFSDGTIQNRWVTTDGTILFKAVKATSKDVLNEELISIYAYHSLIDPTLNVQSNEYLLFTGVINKGKIEDKSDANTIELQGVDRNYVIMNKIGTPQAYKKTQDWTAPLVIKNLLRLGSDNVPSGSYSFKSDGTKVLGTGSYLIDARLFSEGIKTSATSVSSLSDRKLINTSDTFYTDNIEVGDWVRNTTQETYAYVRSVDSETQLTLSKDIMTNTTDNYQISNGFIQDRRSDGSIFPDISFSQLDKPIVESVQDLSQIENLNTPTESDPESGDLIVKRGARYFFDKFNRLHWYIPSDTPEYYMELGQTSAISPDTNNYIIISDSLENKVEDNVNFLIFKAGEGITGEMIKSFDRAKFSGQPIAKESLRNWLHIARGMKVDDEKQGYLTKISGELYSANFPFTPTWTATSISTTSNYLSEFKDVAIARGKAKCQAIFSGLANPRWSGTIQTRGYDFTQGDLINYTNRRKGIIDIKVRINQVNHILNSQQGWITTLTVEEDELETQIR